MTTSIPHGAFLRSQFSPISAASPRRKLLVKPDMLVQRHERRSPSTFIMFLSVTLLQVKSGGDGAEFQYLLQKADEVG